MAGADSGASQQMEMDAGIASGGQDAAPAVGVAVLGRGTHSEGSVNVTEISSPRDGLNLPRDLDFNPERPGELWVVNRADDSTVIYFNAGTPQQRVQKIIDPYALHFMEEVSSISFGQPGRFGTCQESRNTYNGQARANDFMGPSLWPSDLSIYGETNPEAVRDNGGFDLGSHVDMLHESPLCMGITWESDNKYWTFDGLSSSISQYDFRQDHGPGYDDHSDGVIVRWVIGEVKRVADVPSHLVYDHATNKLYIADTGNSRIAVLDTTSGSMGSAMQVVEPGTSMRRRTGTTLETLVDAAGGELQKPSGLALHDGLLYVADNATGRITAFTLEGERVDWLDTSLPGGALMGITVDDSGALWLVDADAYRVLRITAK